MLVTHNADPGDLARCAAVTASSAQPGHEACQIQSGVTRQVDEVSNAWHSAPLAEGPAWVTLRWPQPQQIGSVQCIFDTGFARQLTLTMSDAANRNVIRGPQPETISDYQLDAEVDGIWRPLVTVQANYQRRRFHTFDPVTATSLRLTATATRGVPEARLFELRAYAPGQ